MSKMMKSEKKALVPRLRFPEFRDAGEWNEKQLGDKEISNFVKSRISLNELQKDSYVSTENILPDFGGIREASKLPPSGSFTSYKPGDILIANIRPYLKKVWVADKNGGASNDVIVVRPMNGIRNAFLSSLLKSDFFIDYVMKGAKGLKMPRGDISLMKKYSFAVPSPNEQQRISDCLNSLDALIAAHSEKLDALKTHKKGLMQQLFPAEGETVPRLRFPEFRDAGKWKKSEVGEVFGVTRGYVLSMSLVNDAKTEETPYPVYSSQTKKNGLCGYYGEYLYKDAITWTTDGANAGDVNFRDGKFYCTNVCGVLINDDGYANPCTAELINSVAKKYVSYVGNPKLMNGVMSRIMVPFPKLKEQQKIADCLTSLDALIAAQAEKLDVLKVHKKGLMQQLFPSAEAVEA